MIPSFKVHFLAWGSWLLRVGLICIMINSILLSILSLFPILIEVKTSKILSRYCIKGRCPLLYTLLLLKHTLPQKNPTYSCDFWSYLFFNLFSLWFTKSWVGAKLEQTELFSFTTMYFIYCLSIVVTVSGPELLVVNYLSVLSKFDENW